MSHRERVSRARWLLANYESGVLPLRERAVLRLHAEGLTLREIGERLGISAPRAMQIERQAIERLRAGGLIGGRDTPEAYYRYERFGSP